MYLQTFAMYFILLLLPLAFSSPISKPGCPNQCGSISISFPFGVGSSCSLGPSFNIVCNTSINPHKAYISINSNVTTIEVVEIMSSHIRVKYPYLLAGACYDMLGHLHKSTAGNWGDLKLKKTQYTLSDENWITSMGCDDLMLGVREINKKFHGSGCMSYCHDVNESGGVGLCVGNGQLGSNGCCRTPVPRGTVDLSTQLVDLSGDFGRRKLFPCSYALVEEKGISNQSNFSYPLSHLNHSTEFVRDDWTIRTPPTVRLDWRIGAENCSQARKKSSSYACQDNSDCVDFDVNYIGGYTCHCKKGYKGNPYLTPGCQDINECADKRVNPCVSNSICINTLGSATCLCPKGYYGDGKRKGKGCIRLPKSKILINILIGVGSGVAFLLFLSLCYWLHKVSQKRKCKRLKEKYFKQNGGLLLQQQTNEGTLARIKFFPANELEIATDHYNESRLLGVGGQASVYKGMLSDGKTVAIKKWKSVNENQLEEFVNEVVILSQLNHRNVVKLLGCCLEAEVPILIYEYLPNGTLSSLIHDPNSRFLLSWNMRLKIATDLAGALAYLHVASSIPIYHRDIKSSNLLLDEKYVVKVADFGISKTVAADQTHLTLEAVGIFGYLDPQYFQTNEYTEKSDVYSYGVILAELLTGKKSIFSEEGSDEKINLASHLVESMKKNSLDAILDLQVSQHSRKEDVIEVAMLARKCLNWNRNIRPTMKEVATKLENLMMSQMPRTIEDESEETSVSEASPLSISGIQHARTTNYISKTSSGQNACTFETV